MDIPRYNPNGFEYIAVRYDSDRKQWEAHFGGIIRFAKTKLAAVKKVLTSI